MPCISACIIKHPSKDRVCPICYKHIVGETARLYGNGCQGDPMFVLYLHPGCVTGKDSLHKLQAAQHRLQSDAAARASERRFMTGVKLGLQNGLA